MNSFYNKKFKSYEIFTKEFDIFCKETFLVTSIASSTKINVHDPIAKFWYMNGAYSSVYMELKQERLKRMVVDQTSTQNTWTVHIMQDSDATEKKMF